MKYFGLTLLGAVPFAVAADTSLTTPGGPVHTSSPAVPVPDTSVSVSTVTSSSNLSSTLSLSTTTGYYNTTSTVSTSTVSTTPTPIILTTTANGAPVTMTSFQVITAGGSQPTTAAAPSGSLQAGASSLQNSVKGVAIAALVAVCGVMGTL